MGEVLDSLMSELASINMAISKMEAQIEREMRTAQENIEPLEAELSQIRQDKRNFASRNDFESVQECIRRESNLKFKITSLWNRSSILKNDLSKLKSQRNDLESKISLEKDKIKRNNEILAKMDKVLKNYEKTQSLKLAASDSNISPDSVEQWYEWGKGGFGQTYSYFYRKVKEMDDHFMDLKNQEIKGQMDRVIDAYRKTGSLEDASKIADVSHDTVMYWYEWGSRGFGKENVYFFKKLESNQY